mgnify:FL=1
MLAWQSLSDFDMSGYGSMGDRKVNVLCEVPEAMVYCSPQLLEINLMFIQFL